MCFGDNEYVNLGGAKGSWEGIVGDRWDTHLCQKPFLFILTFEKWFCPQINIVFMIVHACGE